MVRRRMKEFRWNSGPSMRFDWSGARGPSFAQVWLQTLGLVDRTVPAAQLVAKLIIELAQRGERDPTRLRERALNGN